VFGRRSASLISPYRTEDADLVVVALGSVLGTLAETVDELRADGLRVGALGITTFRPFPTGAIRAALHDGQRVIALERAFSIGSGGVVSADLRAALAGMDCPLSTVVAGLGGRPITRPSLRRLIAETARSSDDPAPQQLTFLDLDRDQLPRARGGGAWPSSA